MNDKKLEYNKKMIGQKVKVVDQYGLNWIGEVKEAIDDHSFLIKDESNRDNIVSIYDIRSVDMAHLSQA
tara:strand:- start:1805 stop:2011 length:207 start_codon:yes stop_codon:yes gene_type:complete